jgi:hypothetical protein
MQIYSKNVGITVQNECCNKNRQVFDTNTPGPLLQSVASPEGYSDADIESKPPFATHPDQLPGLSLLTFLQ